MASKFNLAEVIAAQVPQGQPRSIEDITEDVIALKRKAGGAILELGSRLMEAKALLSHGEWQEWLAKRVEFSERSAQNYMRLAREFSNPQTLADLGVSKALALLAVPEEERESFIVQPHMVDGETKNMQDMSSREVDRVIKERDQANALAEQAEKSRLVLVKEMESIKQETTRQAEEFEKTIVKLQRDLEELRSRPVDVAVEPDEAAIQVIQEKLDKAIAGKKRADEKSAALSSELAAAKQTLTDLQKQEKEAALAADKDLATFEVLFLQAQETINKMRGVLIKIDSKGDSASATKLRKALRALSEATGRAAQ